MTSRPDTSGATAILGEVVAVAPDATCAAVRHGGTRAAYQAGCRCPGAVDANRTYNREYARLSQQQPAWRERNNAKARRHKAKILADPTRRATYNARRRAWAKQRRRSDEISRRRLIDDVVVLRLIGGQQVPYNRPERIEAVRQLRQRGLTYLQIAERLHVTERRVHRDLAGLGLVGQEAVA